MRTRSRWPLSLKTTNADRQIPPSGISRVCSGRSVEAKRQNLRSVGMPNEPRPTLFNLAADYDHRLSTDSSGDGRKPFIRATLDTPFSPGESSDAEEREAYKRDSATDR